MKRLLTILASVIVLIGIGVIAYFYFFNKSPAVEVAPEGGGLPVAGQGAVPGDDSSASGEAVETAEAPEAVSARLVKISSGPVVSGFAVTSKAATASSSADASVSYIDRASGNVFVYSSATQGITRTSNRTLPGIQSASWLPDASGAVVRYLSGEGSSTINSYFLRANGTEGFFLPQNLSGVAVSSTTILSLSSAGNGSSVSSSRLDGSGSAQIFTTPLSAVRLSYLGKTNYLLVTKASATLPGYAFSVSGRAVSRISGPMFGLSAIASPSGAWIAESSVIDGAMHVALVDTTTRERIPLPISTLVEKCAWSADSKFLYCGVPTSPPQATYPDDWYQGAVHFSDKIWKIDVAGRYAQLVLDFHRETDVRLDAESLSIDPETSFLVFLNKNDESVWGYTL